MIVVCSCQAHSQVNTDPQPAKKPPSADKPEEANPPAKADDEKEKWSIESPPGPSAEQPIDVSEGTWITVDVHPTGCEIVFDLFGDIYVMPIGYLAAKSDWKRGRFTVNVPNDATDDLGTLTVPVKLLLGDSEPSKAPVR